jgi:hypothetical protein
MERPMTFNFEACVDVLKRAAIEALTENSDAIRELHQTEPLWALSFDVIAWQPYVGLAFRLESESGLGASTNSADWKHSHFIEDIRSRPLSAAAKYVHDIYQNTKEDIRQETLHLIILAAAHAILDRRVAQTLQSMGIEAPEIGDRLEGTYFKYFVMDSDELIRANYCDIVRANRATRHVLGRIV